MALRVLLADESVTIKKVFQLALQDYAVEVTTVNVGTDVVQVAAKIRPDIIFADVLLQKKSGYDVSREIKSHPQLSSIPVVLIWSGFMELDQSKFKSSGAQAHLEKPFDTQKLRKVIQDLVPKTKTQPLSNYLNFPRLPDFEELAPSATATKPQPMDLPPIPQASGSWSMESFAPLNSIPSADDELPEEFLTVDLPAEPPRPGPIRSGQKLGPLLEEDSDEEEAAWVQKTLSRYKLDPALQVEDEPVIKLETPEEEAKTKTFLSSVWGGTNAPNSAPPPVNPPLTTDEDEFEGLDLTASEDQVTPPPVTTKTVTRTASQLKPNAPTVPQLDERQLEEIIRAQSQEVIEKVVWQIVPEIATRIIERELERLLKERN